MGGCILECPVIDLKVCVWVGKLNLVKCFGEARPLRICCVPARSVAGANLLCTRAKRCCRKFVVYPREARLPETCCVPALCAAGANLMNTRAKRGRRRRVKNTKFFKLYVLPSFSTTSWLKSWIQHWPTLFVWIAIIATAIQPVV